MTNTVAAVASVAGLAAAAVLLVAVAPAWGHSFQVEHRPAHGARLDRPPEEVRLQFSEAVLADARVTVRLASEDLVPTGPPRLEAGERVLRASLLDPSATGVYLVSWHVVSAVDGHETAGEFAFAVGDVASAVPAANEDQATLSLWRTVSSWLLLGGVSLGAGALLVLRFLPLARADQGFVSRLALTGLGGALAGAAANQVPAQASAEAASAAAGVISATPTVLTWFAAGVLAGALALTWRGRAPAVALGAVTVAGAAWSASSHAATYAGVAGGFVDFLHLASAAGWVGSLTVVAAVLWRPGGGASGEGRLPLVRAYARVALPLVVVVTGTGIVSATHLLTRLTDLMATGYGRVLVAKTAFVAVALALAVVGRLRGLPPGRLPVLRRVTAGEAGLLTVVLMLTAGLTNLGPPVGGAQVETLLGPPPLEEPVAWAAGLAGSLTVSLTAADDQLHVQVFGPSGGIDGAQIDATVQMPDDRTIDLRPRSCGAGCFTQQLDLARGAMTVTVDADAPGWTGGRFEGRLLWPPAPTDPQLLRDLVQRMREVSELEIVERVSSGGGTPDETVVRLSGEAFLEVVPYGAGEAVAVRPVADDPDAIEFHMPAARMWFTVWKDEQGRVREQRLVNPGHEIHHGLRYPAR